MSAIALQARLLPFIYLTSGPLYDTKIQRPTSHATFYSFVLAPPAARHPVWPHQSHPTKATSDLIVGQIQNILIARCILLSLYFFCAWVLRGEISNRAVMYTAKLILSICVSSIAWNSSVRIQRCKLRCESKAGLKLLSCVYKRQNQKESEKQDAQSV